jgi:hypothetical protein
VTLSIAELKDIAEVLSHATVVLGFPVAIYQYRRSKLKEQSDREYGTYNALDEKYLDFQKMCFEHPELDIFDIPDAEPRAVTDEEQKQELIAFTMLISVFERAYLMYHDESNRVKTAQWTGWHEYICSYCERDNFRNAWDVSGETFDRNFERYVEDVLQRSRIAAAKPRLPPFLEIPHIKVIELSAKSPEYLASLRLLSQYGWAGGTFNTNELSYLLQASSSVRITKAYALTDDSRESLGLAVISYLAPDICIVHDMVVPQAVNRDTAFGQFSRILFPELRRAFPSARWLVAEVPRNEPRHLKTEVFTRGLVSAGFEALRWTYQLPSGFNHRTTAAPGMLYALSVSETTSITRQLFLGIVQTIYNSLYKQLWVSMGGSSADCENERRRLVNTMQRETAVDT